MSDRYVLLMVVKQIWVATPYILIMLSEMPYMIKRESVKNNGSIRDIKRIKRGGS